MSDFWCYEDINMFVVGRNISRLHVGLCLWLDSMKSIYRSNINMIVLMTAAPVFPLTHRQC